MALAAIVNFLSAALGQHSRKRGSPNADRTDEPRVVEQGVNAKREKTCNALAGNVEVS
jgi:hypothetical protein